MTRLAMIGVALVFAGAGGCTAASPTTGPALTGAPDDVASAGNDVTASYPIGTTLRTTTAVNFRTGAGTSYSVIRVLPQGTNVVTVNQTTPKNSFYNVQQQGTTGWVHGNYLAVVGSVGTGGSGGSGGGGGSGASSGSAGAGGPPPPNGARAEAISRADLAVGYSYWWGHGVWRADGTDLGSCSGSCPSCTHSGSYGADCSGMVAKAWQVPPSNNDITVDAHPYSSGDFISNSSQWTIVSRNLLLPADALAYNTGSEGHVVLWESGDGWGSSWVYECRGCSYGCVHDLRTFSSVYTAARRSGY
jgi:hypothetical protein